jgi:hypothetical protein
MAQRSPTLEGFRVLFRRPSLTFAEVAWRWSFGAAGGLLLSALMVEYLDTLPVGPRDLLFLDSGQPTLVTRALNHIFRGSSLRLTLGALVVFSALAIAWTLVSAIGRSACLQAIIEYFYDGREASFTESQQPAGRWQVGSLAGLNFLRLAAGLAAVIAGVGAVVVPTVFSTRQSPKPGLAFVLTLVLLLLVSLAWQVVNWTLSLSAIFAVRDRSDSFGALAAAARFSRDRAAGLWAINFWFGLVHLALFFLGTTAASMILGLAQILPGALILTALLMVTLLYFVAADSIHVGRIAAWYCLAETPLAPVAAASIPPTSPAEPENPIPSPAMSMQEYPPEDDILSDVEAQAAAAPPPLGPEA